MIQLNAFTNGFHGLYSTTGVGKPQNVEWVYHQNPFDGVTLFEDGWMFQDTDAVKSRYKMGWLVEPRGLRPENYEQAWEARHKFDFILTYDRELLERDPDKFKLCPRMGVHIPREKWGLPVKSQDVAMIVTHKNATPGHKLRHEVEAYFKGKIDFFGRECWADKVQIFSHYRFVVVIESERTDNWFTEHLLDAIALGCVPIYWGAPNINNYLEIAPLLTWENLVQLCEIIRAANTRGEKVYAYHLPALKRNQVRLPEYRLAEDWIYEHYLKALP